MLSCRSFIDFGFTVRPVIYFVLAFIYGVRFRLKLISFGVKLSSLRIESQLSVYV